jgi:phosphopantothenate synthetase
MGKFIAGVIIGRIMLKKDERVLILPASAKHAGVRLVPVKKGDRVVAVPTRGGKSVAVKLSPLNKGDKIAVLTLRSGRKVALKLEEFTDADLENPVELAGDITIEFREGGAS